MDDDFFVIAVDSVDQTQRTLIHEAIKVAALDWWHQFDHLWIVRGKTAKEWRDFIIPFVPLAPSAVLVLELPKTGRSWASQMPGGTKKSEWLKERYTYWSGESTE